MAEGHAERRLVTAMFIDIVGSTELVALGPERMKRVLDRCFADLAAEVTAEGGTVEKYIGDAIFVIFGAPVSHEDDALRALRAAWRCLAKAAIATDGRPAIPIRVGVETGDALVDLAAAQTDRQRMAVGACVNVATRLQAVAAPGTALVGPGTREAVGDGAALEPIGEVELKGLGRSPAWRLVGASQQHARPRVPFIGRDAELEVLQLAFRRATGGRSVLAVVSGPPGQGKTRVVEELVTRIGDQAAVLLARCRPAGERSPLEPLRQLLDATSAEEVHARVTRIIADPIEADRVADALSHSAGLRTSDALRGMPVADRQDEITNAWRRYLASLARERPVVAWVEDLHWADPQLVALIDRLTLSGSSPLLFVVTARPEFAQQAGIRPTGQRFFIDLDPLAADEAQRLAVLAGGIGDPITSRAEGNPLFIIELARARALRHDALPMTLRGAIGARLTTFQSASGRSCRPRPSSVRPSPLGTPPSCSRAISARCTRRSNIWSTCSTYGPVLMACTASTTGSSVRSPTASCRSRSGCGCTPDTRAKAWRRTTTSAARTTSGRRSAARTPRGSGKTCPSGWR